MTVIKALDYIESGFSAEDAMLLSPLIDNAKNSDEGFAVDFYGVQYFTTLFFSSALTRLVGEMGIDDYNRRVHVYNLSESGAETYNHALNYAKEYYEKTQEERDRDFRSVSSALEDI